MIVRLHRRTLTLGAAFLAFACLACAQSEPEVESGPNPAELVRPELLTADEVMSGPVEIVNGVVYGKATFCGPDDTQWFPTVRENDPNVISFDQSTRWVTVGVWDLGSESAWEKDPERYMWTIDDINRKARGTYCRLGPKAAAVLEGRDVDPVDEWRVYPLDFGQSTAAFRSVMWRLKSSASAPQSLMSAEGAWVYSVARVYGLVEGRFVRIEIGSHALEPPSEEELRSLWEAQLEKLRFRDAVTRFRQAQSEHGAQSGSSGQSSAVDSPPSQ